MQLVFDRLVAESRSGAFFIDLQKVLRSKDFAQIFLLKICD